MLGTVPVVLLRGVKGAALKACEEKVDFLDIFEGVKDGDSTLKAFFVLFGDSVSWVQADVVEYALTRHDGQWKLSEETRKGHANRASSVRVRTCALAASFDSKLLQQQHR